MTYKIKGWHKFQHFKDRKPPWIKLYRDILDDPDWHELDAEAAKMLVMLWLLASEDEGRLPELKKIAFRLRISEQKAKSLIDKLSHWLEQDDINAISTRYQDDAPETETETEKRRGALTCPDDVTESVWADFLTLRKTKKAPVTETALVKIRNEAVRAGVSLEDALRECCSRGWQGFKADWMDKPAQSQGVDL